MSEHSKPVKDLKKNLQSKDMKRLKRMVKAVNIAKKLPINGAVVEATTKYGTVYKCVYRNHVYIPVDKSYTFGHREITKWSVITPIEPTVQDTPNESIIN